MNMLKVGEGRAIQILSNRFGFISRYNFKSVNMDLIVCRFIVYNARINENFTAGRQKKEYGNYQ